MITRRDKRLEQEEKTRASRRSRRAAWYYRKYLHALVPIQWRFLPTPQHLIDTECRDFPSFKALVNVKEEPTSDAWKEAAAKLPTELSAHLVSQLAVLRRVMPDLMDMPNSFEFALASEGTNRSVLNALAARFACLDLARSVFMRGPYDWTIGCDNPHAWDLMSISPASKGPVFSPQGSAAVRTFADLVGKPYANVTATEMDIACGDTWYSCSCFEKSDKQKTGFLGWRGFVRLFLSSGP